MQEKIKKLAELAELVAGEINGDPETAINGLGDLATARAGEIAFIAKANQQQEISSTKASAVIVPLAVNEADRPIIRVKNPYLAAAIIHNFFLEKPFIAAGPAPNAHIGADCRIPAEVTISPMAVLGDRISLGRRVTIQPGVVLADDVEIGDDTLLHANVTVAKGCKIGSRVIIHSGTVIGSDGFGYGTDEQGRHTKRPHVGIVQIDDDVEIGANVCIDRGTFGRTWIRKGAKIDNLVQIAHNVEVGENSLIVSQVGIAGSTTLGGNVVLGGQVGVKGHIKLDDGVMVAAKSGVHNNQSKGSIIAGIPALPHQKWLRATIVFAKIPDLFKEVRKLGKKVAELGQDLDRLKEK